MVHIAAEHAGHLPGSWIATLGLVVVSLAMLVVVAIVMDRRPPD